MKYPEDIDKLSLVEESLSAYGVKPIQLDTDLGIITAARNGAQTNLLWDFLKSIKSSN